MLTCKEVAKILASKTELSVVKRMELRLHLAMCKHCSNYEKQLKILTSAMKELFEKMGRTDPQVVKKIENEVLKNIKKINSSQNQ